jgi:hypothetical protein
MQPDPVRPQPPPTSNPEPNASPARSLWPLLVALQTIAARIVTERERDAA